MSVEQMMTLQAMETPSSSVGLCELPCGYITPDGRLYTDAQVREITGYEEDMLVSDAVPASQKLDMLLAGCTVRIGPVSDPGALAAIIPTLTVGDRVAMLFAIRRATIGDALPMRHECPNKECRTKSLFVVNLSDLKIQKMADPMKRVYDVTLPSGRTVRFRVSTGEDEARTAKFLKKDKMDAVSQMMLMRLDLLDGQPPSLEMLKKMGMKDRSFLRREFNRVEGGVDTSIDLECPKCGTEWTTELNVSANSFFSLQEQQKA